MEMNKTMTLAKMNICRYSNLPGTIFWEVIPNCAVANWPRRKGLAGQLDMVADFGSCVTGQTHEYAGGTALDDQALNACTDRMCSTYLHCQAQTSIDLQ